MTRIYDLVMTHKLDADQSPNPQMGVPDELVSAIARRLVEGVSELIHR